MIASEHLNQLPTRLIPGKQETLASFVQRCADANEIPVSLLLKGCQGLAPVDLTKREKLPLSGLAGRLGVSEDALDAMSPRHRLISPVLRFEGWQKGTRWECSECEALGIGSHSEMTWLRFVCEEHGVYLQVNTMAPEKPILAEERAVAIQARANSLLRDSWEAYEIVVRLLSIVKQLRRLSVLMKTYEVLPETQPILSWLEKIEITPRQSVQTPHRAAMLLCHLLPMVFCRGFGAAMASNLRVLCERPASTSGYQGRDRIARRQASNEVWNLMRIGRAVTELVDVHGLREDDVPAIYLTRNDPDWLSLHRDEPHVRRAAAGMWNSRLHACHEIYESVATYRNGPEDQEQAERGAGRRARHLIGTIDTSPITSTAFAVELTEILRRRSMHLERSGMVGLPVPAFRWLMPDIGASLGVREALEHWLWIRGPVQEPRFWLDSAVPLEDIWQLDVQMTVEQKLQALELSHSVSTDLEERRNIRRISGETTKPEAHQSQSDKYQVG